MSWNRGKNEQICTVKFQNFLGAPILGRGYGAPPQNPPRRLVTLTFRRRVQVHLLTYLLTYLLTPLGTPALRASVPRSGPSALHRPSLCVVDILRYFRPCVYSKFYANNFEVSILCGSIFAVSHRKVPSPLTRCRTIRVQLVISSCIGNLLTRGTELIVRVASRCCTTSSDVRFHEIFLPWNISWNISEILKKISRCFFPALHSPV